MLRTYKYRVYPTKDQVLKLESTFELCRNLYNASLQQRRDAYKSVNPRSVFYNQQQNELPELKAAFPDYKNIHSLVLQDVLHRTDKAMKGFFLRLKTKNSKAGYPRYKSYGRYDSITYSQSGFEILQSNKKRTYVALSKIGNIKIVYHREIPAVANIKTCIVKRDGKKWFVCFAIETNIITKPVKIKTEVGIDMGLTSFLATSDNRLIPNPRILRESENKLAIEQRKLAKKKKGGKNRLKQTQKVRNVHTKIFNQRNDFQHKVSRKLVNEYDFIAHEDLNIKGMVKNHCLAKSISDVGWGKFISMVRYKAEEAGKVTVAVNPKNTSQECFGCGKLVPKTLQDRIHKCPYCGLTLDRDVNSAKVILSRGKELALHNKRLGRNYKAKIVSMNQEAPSFRAE